MNKCLSCEKEVKNKYCNVSCQNKHQRRNRKANPESIRKREFTKQAKWKTFHVHCNKCNEIVVIKEYNVKSPKKEKYFCSRSCANSRIKTEEIKRKISESAKKSEKVKLANKLIALKNKKRIESKVLYEKIKWRKNKKSIYQFKKESIKKEKNIYSTLCKNCNKEIQSYKRNIKYHKECWLKCSGGYRKGSSRGKHGWYKGYWCDSSYELAWIIWALDNKINFTRNTNAFDYVYQNKVHKYYPDFIIDNEYYLEIKNFHSEITDAKISNFPHSIEVYYKDRMKYYVEYAIQKFGKNFTSLYENVMGLESGLV